MFIKSQQILVSTSCPPEAARGLAPFLTALASRRGRNAGVGEKPMGTRGEGEKVETGWVGAGAAKWPRAATSPVWGKFTQ